VGGGSAGFLAALGLKTRLPNLDVTVLHSKALGIIGVGEATTLVLPTFLHAYLKFDYREFYELAQPQWKLGIRFLWGKRPWFDFPFGTQMLNQYQGLPKIAAFYCPDGPFDYVGVTSGLMTQNKAFSRRPDGGPMITNTAGYHLENVGMRVPYETTYKPSAADLEQWQRVRAACKQNADTALTALESLAILRSPQWQWPKIY
jgi:tryptophan halogenase